MRDLDRLRKPPAWVAVTTFTASWTNFNTSTHYAAAYCKDPWGFVRLRGCIKDGTITSAAFTLPADYRPTKTCTFGVESNGAFGAVNITSAGAVVPQIGNNAYVYLDNISFYAG